MPKSRWKNECSFFHAAICSGVHEQRSFFGTPFCITVDFDSLEDRAVTVRERDSMEQVRIGMDGLEEWLSARLPAC